MPAFANRKPVPEEAALAPPQALEADRDAAPGGDGPGGQVQNAPLARATRKRLDALRADLAQRVAAATPAPATGHVGQSVLTLLRAHRASGEPAPLAEAKALVASAAPGRGRDARLDDLAWLGRAYLHLHDATGSDLHLDAAERLADAVRRLEVPRGGFRTTPTTAPDQLDGTHNGAAACFLVELAWRIGVRGGHRDAAEKALRRLCVPVVLDGQPQAWAPLLGALDALLAEPVHATVTGPWENAAVARLHRACLRLAHDPLVLDWSPANADFPDVGAPAVYLSHGSRCASPVTDEARLAETVARLLQA